MVSFTVYRANSGGAYVEGVCLATDEKPIAGITNGSILFAVDTTDGSLTRYMFDQNSATWIETECPCSCDGGGEGGAGLPDVDGDDNGKVLTVVEGEWAAAPSGGGSGALYIGYTEEGLAVTADKTWDEVYDAMESGVPVFLRYAPTAPDGMAVSLPVLACGYNEDYQAWGMFYLTLNGVDSIANVNASSDDLIVIVDGK